MQVSMIKLSELVGSLRHSLGTSWTWNSVRLRMIQGQKKRSVKRYQIHMKNILVHPRFQRASDDFIICTRGEQHARQQNEHHKLHKVQ